MGGLEASSRRSPKFEVSIGSLDDTKRTVHAQYRPPQVQIDKSIQWVKNQRMIEGEELQLLFTEPEGRVTSLELFFDAAESKNTSVEDAINALTYLTTARISDPNNTNEPWRKRPHHCVLVMGNVYRNEVFKCVIESLSTKITMFSAEGTPIRATVTVRLREASSVALSTAANTQAARAASPNSAASQNNTSGTGAAAGSGASGQGGGGASGSQAPGI